MEDNVDLSEPDPITKDFSFPTNETLIPNVTIRADQIGNSAVCIPDDNCRAHFNNFKAGAIYQEYLTFAGSTTQTVDFVNPFPSSYWIQLKYESPSYSKTYVSCSDLTAPPAASSMITLPAIVDNGPSSAPDASSINYESGTGTLSITAVSDANVYNFRINDDAINGIIALVISSSNVVTLPQWLMSRLSGKTVTITITIGNFSNYFLMENYSYLAYGPNVQGAEISGGLTPFQKTIVIP